MQQQLGPDGRKNSPNLFEPAFRNGNAGHGGARLQGDPEEEEDDDELGRRLKSQHSVVSNWSQVNMMNIMNLRLMVPDEVMND